MDANTVLRGQNDYEDVPSPSAIKRVLTAPFGREFIRFREIDGDWLPYIEGDDLRDRLIRATRNRFDLAMGDWHWKDQQVIAYGHLDIPGLGRRGGIGSMKHTSNAGKDMSPAMLHGLVTDLLKNALIAFDCGTQVRRMDSINFDPRKDRARLQPYLDYYFPPAGTAAGVPIGTPGAGILASTAPGQSVTPAAAAVKYNANVDCCPRCRDPFFDGVSPCRTCSYTAALRKAA